MLELKAYGWIQHSLNGNWKKVTDYEYDIKFLVQNHGVRTLSIVKKYVSQSEYEEIQKLINDVKV